MTARHGSGELLGRIAAEIGDEGPIGFDRYMELALYDPEAGYFSSGELRSDRAGDFLTSPEVSPLFGTTLARFVDAEYERLGDPFTIAEVGGGSGSLLEPLLDGVSLTPERVLVVERSPAARAASRERVPSADVVDAIGSLRGVVVANELLDNLPAALLVRRGSGWMERQVGLEAGRLVLLEGEPRPDVVAWADRFAGPVPEGGQVEAQLEAHNWVRSRLERLESGALVAFDYGELAENLEHRRAEGTVRTYRGHHLGPDPLAEPGGTDITMDVNFSAVVDAAEAAGASVELHRQDDFLEEWGLRDRIAQMREEALEAAREGRTMDQLMLKSQINGAETLLHPRGLGDFRVLVARV